MAKGADEKHTVQAMRACPREVGHIHTGCCLQVLIDGEHDASFGATLGSSPMGDPAKKQPEGGYTLPPLEMRPALKLLNPVPGQAIRHTGAFV